MKKIILLTILFFYCFQIVIYAQHAGDLDSSFGTHGIIRADLGESYESGKDKGKGRQVLILPDNSIYVICEINGETLIAKRLPNGSVDLTYGKRGFSNSVPMTKPYGAIQSDGKVVIVGAVGNNEVDLARFNTDGSLDDSFSNDGKLVVDSAYDNTYLFERNSVAVQNDGKIVVAGTIANNTDFAITRYNPDGSLDNTFNGNGKQVTDFGSDDFTTSLAIQNNGKILVAGVTRIGDRSNENFAIARYNTDGSLDNSFSGDGKQTTDFNPADNDSSFDIASSLLIQHDGKILLTGFSIYNIELVRYNNDGSLDNTFSDDGRQATDIITAGGGNYATSAALQSDGKIVLAGYVNKGNDFDFALARYNLNGSLDNSFSEDGKLITDIGTFRDVASSIAVKSDGNIVVTGNTIDFNSTNRCVLVQYTSSGSFDNKFNNGQSFLQISLHGSTNFKKLAVQSDGKVIAAGTTYNGTNFVDILVRFNTSGSIDTSFNKNGLLEIAKVSDYFEPVVSIAIQNDGKIVVAILQLQGGQIGDPLISSLARYNANGSLDNSFNTDIVSNTFRISLIAIQNDGKIVAAGSETYEEEFDGSDFAVARYNTDGSLDKTFNNYGMQTTDFGDDNSTDYNSDGASAVVIQKDGKIVLVGSTTSLEHSQVAMARYTTDGKPDNTFSEDGKLTFPISGYLDDVTSAAIQSNGKIAVAGGARVNDEQSALYVELVNPDGSLYKGFTSFNSTDYNNYSIANSIAVQANDKILVAGLYNGTSVVFRLNADATFDSTFANNGNLDIEANTIINNIAVSNNKLYAVGNTLDNIGVVARYLLDGTNQTAPSVTLTIPNNIVKYSAPARIKLNAAVSDASGHITKVQFYSGSTLLLTEDVFPYGFLWIDVPVGTYTVTAKAFDNSGTVITSNGINVSVVEENVPPVVSIVSPANDTTYSGPATIKFVAQANDANDRISKVEFYNGTALLETEYYYPYTFTWINVQTGTYHITAKAYDSKGLSTASDPVTVTVTNNSFASRPSAGNYKNNLNASLSLALSPNPAGNTLQIFIKGLQLSKTSTISIVSAAGIVLKTIQSNASEKVVQLDVSSLIKGTYTVKVISGDKVMLKQFMKM